MRKFVNKGIFTILIASAISMIGCKKAIHHAEDSLTSDQKTILTSFSGSSMAANELDLASVKRINSSDPDLYTVTARIKGPNSRFFILKIDSRSKGTILTSAYVFESSIRNGILPKEYASLNGTGDFYVTSLESEIPPIKISFKNGVRSDLGLSPGSLITSGTSGLQKKTNLYEDGGEVNTTDESKLAKCINDSLNSLTFGEMLVFIATMPDSYAALLIGCAITVLIKR